MILIVNAYHLTDLWNELAILIIGSPAPLGDIIDQGLSLREEVEDRPSGALGLAPIHTCILNFHTIIILGLGGKFKSIQLGHTHAREARLRSRRRCQGSNARHP